MGVPSWSWASVKGPINFMAAMSATTADHRPSSRTTPWLRYSSDASISIAKGNGDGNLDLLIQAQVRNLEFWLESAEWNRFSPGWPVWIGGTVQGYVLQNPIGSISFDCQPKEVQQESKDRRRLGPLIEVIAVRLITFEQVVHQGREAIQPQAFGVLLLQPHNEDGKLFERVGVGLIVETRYFDSSTPIQTLKLR